MGKRVTNESRNLLGATHVSIATHPANSLHSASSPGSGSPNDDQILCVARLSCGLRSPARGGMIIAQGKAAAAAALGKPRPAPNLSFFQSGLARPGHAKPDWKKERRSFFVSYPGRRSFLACPYLIVLTGLQLGSLRSHLRRTFAITGSAPVISNMESRRYRGVRMVLLANQGLS